MRSPRALAVLLGFVLTLGLLVPAEAGEFLLRIGDFQVPAGTVVHGDAIAIGGTLDIEGSVQGKAVAIGGDIQVGGRVRGSVRSLGGNVTVRSTAAVGGAVSAWGGRVDIEPGAIVAGPHPHSGPPASPRPFSWFPIPGPQAVPGPWWWPPAFLGFLVGVKVLFWLLLFMSLAGFVGGAWLMAVLFPGAIAHLAGLLERAPAASFGVGLLGWALLGPVVVLLILSIVGLTLVFLIPVLLLLMLQFGMTAIAVMVGRRVHQSGTGLEAVIGAVILAVGFAIPHLGGLLAFAVGTWGLGVVLLALVERRRVRPLVPPAPPAQP